VTAARSRSDERGLLRRKNGFDFVLTLGGLRTTASKTSDARFVFAAPLAKLHLARYERVELFFESRDARARFFAPAFVTLENRLCSSDVGLSVREACAGVFERKFRLFRGVFAGL
jgi:hypothetical protein